MSGNAKFRWFLLALILVIVSGCASAPLFVLDSGAEKVVVAFEHPGGNYKVIGQYQGLMEKNVVDLDTKGHTKEQKQI